MSKVVKVLGREDAEVGVEEGSAEFVDRVAGIPSARLAWIAAIGTKVHVRLGE